MRLKLVLTAFKRPLLSNNRPPFTDIAQIEPLREVDLNCSVENESRDSLLIDIPLTRTKSLTFLSANGELYGFILYLLSENAMAPFQRPYVGRSMSVTSLINIVSKKYRNTDMYLTTKNGFLCLIYSSAVEHLAIWCRYSHQNGDYN
jgi:hypothetical protein